MWRRRTEGWKYVPDAFVLNASMRFALLGHNEVAAFGSSGVAQGCGVDGPKDGNTFLTICTQRIHALRRAACGCSNTFLTHLSVSGHHFYGSAISLKAEFIRSVKKTAKSPSYLNS